MKRVHCIAMKSNNNIYSIYNSTLQLLVNINLLCQLIDRFYEFLSERIGTKINIQFNYKIPVD